MTALGRQQVPWTEEELSIARSDLPLHEIRGMLVGRSASAIAMKRLGMKRRSIDMAALGKLSGAARRLVSIETKNRFIDAVKSGAQITKNGIVSRSTYLSWARQDPGFFEWLASFRVRQEEERERARRDAATDKARRATERAALRKAKVEAEDRKQNRLAGRTLETRLRQCDVYEISRSAVGEVNPRFVREEAISSMVLDLLSGDLDPQDAKKCAPSYISKARREVSYFSADAPIGKAGKTLLDTYADREAA